MPHIYAEIPEYQGTGLGGGFDLVQQITVGGLQRVFRDSIDMDAQAAIIPRMIENDDDKRQEYIDQNLWPFRFKMGAFDVRLEPATEYMRLEGQVNMVIEDGTVLTGRLMVRIPLRRIVVDYEPRVVLHCIHMKQADVTLNYTGARPAETLTFAAEDHAAMFWGGFLFQDAIDLTARQSQLNPSGLNKQDVDFKILPDDNPLRIVLSIRYAFHAHDEHNSTQLERWLDDLYDVDLFGWASGGSRVPAGSEGGEARDVGLQFLPGSAVSFGGDGIQPRLVVERTCRYKNKPLTGRALVPLKPDEPGNIRARFDELKSMETGLGDEHKDFKDRLLESFKALGKPVVIDMAYASGQAGVQDAPQYPLRGVMHSYHHKKSHLRLFIERPLPRKSAHVNLVPLEDEMALALDRRLVSGMVWDAFSTINTDLRSRYKVPGDLSRWSAACEEGKVNVNALIDIDGWLDPGSIGGSFKAEAVEGKLKINPDLNFDLPVTAKILGISVGLFTALNGGGLGFCLSAFFAFLGFGLLQSLNWTLNSGAGSQSGLNLDMLELRIGEKGAGYRPWFRSAGTSRAGILLTGRLEQIVKPLDGSSHPLTIDGHKVYQLTGRREIEDRTVAYRLNSGDIVPIEQLVLLVEAGLPLPGVHVVHAATGAYLRADPDVATDNNLANLPLV